MNPKVLGIVILIVGLGVGLYLVNSGEASKFGSLFAMSTSTPAATKSASATTTFAVATSAYTPLPAAPTSFGQFLSSLFSSLSGHGGPFVGSAAPGGASTGYGSAGGQSPLYGTGGAGYGASGGDVGPIPPGFTAAQLSPYFHKIYFGGVGTQQISLYTYANYGQPASTVDITGWEIKTNRGGEYIPQAVNAYDPLSANAGTDIFLALNQSDYVYLYSNSAPVNMRLNECIGYLNTPRQFNPSFPYDCPYVDRSQISNFTGACQNYILSLGNCMQPDFGSPYFPHNDYQCEQYLEHGYNYRACVSTHAADANFLKNEWRIWMGSSPLDQYHDNVQLLDRNGLLVDSYRY